METSVPTINPIGKWNYLVKRDYGNDASYLEACKFLENEPVEDWGCGACYAKKFFKDYIGIDGSGDFADKRINLEEYQSKTPNLLMRHILEHNYSWQKVLNNALSSFTNKMSLVIFTPFADKTHNIYSEPNGIPNLSFKKSDLENEFKKHGCLWEEKTFKSNTQFGEETIFYLKHHA